MMMINYNTITQVRASRAKQVAAELAKNNTNIIMKREDFFIGEICEQQDQDKDGTDEVIQQSYQKNWQYILYY